MIKFLPALLILTLLLSACVDTRHTIRQVDQHPAGAFNTVETSGERIISIPPFYSSTEYLGINFWHCLQSENRLNCERICDDRWDRICAPSLKNEFGSITRPTAGIVIARYKARHEGSQTPTVQEKEPEKKAPEEVALEESDEEESDEVAADDESVDEEEEAPQ